MPSAEYRPPPLHEWFHGKTGAVSIDADFFTLQEERQLTPLVQDLVVKGLAAGAAVAFRDEHVDLVQLVSAPLDFIVNFDYHMDCRIEFLFGDETRTPPCSATLFETLLSSGLTEKYVWAFPSARRRQVASVYASALIASRQELLSRLHCINGRHALDLLSRATIASIFVCRSPDYSTVSTDAIYMGLRSLVRPFSSTSEAQ